MSTHKDTGKRVIFLSFLFTLLIIAILIINQVATQYIAAAFGYDIALGKPIFGHIYEPFHWIIWIFQFGSTNKQFFNLVIINTGAAMIGVIILFVVLKLLLYRQAKSYDDVHGSAHWAKQNEIEKMGLLNQQKGVYIGAWQDPKTNTIK